MAELKGTIVASRIVPTDSLDTYATHDEGYGRGSYRSESTIADRDAIPPERRKEGMLVNVLADNKIYKLVGGIDNTNWTVFDNKSDTTGYIAGGIVHSLRAVMINTAGDVVHAQPESAMSVIGISKNNASIGEIINVATKDTISDPSLSLTPGLPVFFLTDGIITQTPPATISSCVIGVATATTSFIFNKQLPIFLI